VTRQGETLVFLDLPRGNTATAAHALGFRTAALVPSSGSAVGAASHDAGVLDEVIPLEHMDLASTADALRDMLARGRSVRLILTHVEVLVPLAAALAERFGLEPLVADTAAVRDKVRMKEVLASAGVPMARYRVVRTAESAAAAARSLGYPAVLKPSCGTASRGVVRVDDERALHAAFRAVKRLALASGDESVLVERYLPGAEVGVEAVAHAGGVDVALLSDKPDPLEGPFFEESLYAVPSQAPAPVRRRVEELTRAAVEAVGVRRGPAHVELRWRGTEVWVLEVAARPGSPPAYVSDALATSYEELFLRALTAADPVDVSAPRRAAGYLLVRSPGDGVIESIAGLDAAMAVPYVCDVRTFKGAGDRVVAVPDFNGYLATVYAHGPDRDAVVRALRRAEARLDVTITPSARIGVWDASIRRSGLAAGRRSGRP
jgi:biotin carboxylase